MTPPLGPGATLLAALALLIGCSAFDQAPLSGAPRAVLQPIVARDAIFTAPGTAPDALVTRLASSRLLLLGETHYVEEHQQLLAALLPRLHAAGFRTLVDEMPHATAWTGEEYVMGRGATVPRPLAMFDQALLDGLRAFNAGLPDADRIHFAGFDMNHWPSHFQTGVSEFQARFGPVAALDQVMATTPDTPAYLTALQALPASLAADRLALEASLGSRRLAQLTELVEVERRSQPLRVRFDDAAREAIIVERVAATLSAAGGSGLVVNCGMNHAQKETLSGPTAQVVGTWLAHHPETYGGNPAGLTSIAFAGARGLRLSHFSDPVAWSFDLTAEDPDNSLTRILAELAADQLAWLPLGNPVFSSQAVTVDYGHAVQVLPVGRQYDWVVLYPSVSVLRSLSMP